MTQTHVNSWNGRTGAVVPATNDYTWAQIDKTTSNIADITTRSHTSLTDIGTNTHAQIDSHISSNHVNSFNGRTGAVVPATNDYTWAQIDKTISSIANITTRDHDLLNGLSDDDHTIYALLAGRSPGQTIKGGTASGENLTLMSTANATKGKIFFGTSTYDELNNRLGVNIATPAEIIHVFGKSVNNNYFLFEAPAGVSGGSSSWFDIRGRDGSDNLIRLWFSAHRNAYAVMRVSTNHPLAFDTNNTERMRIKETGEVGIGTTSPNTTALLDLTSTTKGALMPRMTTTQRDAISTPATGLYIYNTSTNKFNFYNGSAWEAVTSA